MAGKVLVSTQEHIDRLVAARLQADLMGAPTVLIARTDAESAKLLDNNVDGRDHPFILGCTNASLPHLNSYLMDAENQHKEQHKQPLPKQRIDQLMESWDRQAGLATFPQAVTSALQHSSHHDKLQRMQEWQAKCYNLCHADARQLAKKLLGHDPFWCWDRPRTREGLYRIRGSVDYCIARAIAYAPYCDLLWMESTHPSLKDAQTFATSVRARAPYTMFAYNLSPSFNWDQNDIDDHKIGTFMDELAKYGYVWQFITLAGFHVNSLAITRFSRSFHESKMLAYVQMVQRQERQEKVDTLTHQKWSGAELMDEMVTIVTGGMGSTSAMQHGNTEAQFAKQNAHSKS